MYLFGIVFECWSGFLAFTRERSREEAAFSQIHRDSCASCRAGADLCAVMGPSGTRGTLQVQQHQLCSTTSSQVCQHCSEMIKSPKCKFSVSSQVAHFLGGILICLRMTLFLIPFDCSLETFLHVFAQLSTIACLCCSLVLQDRRFPFLSSLQK